MHRVGPTKILIQYRLSNGRGELWITGHIGEQTRLETSVTAIDVTTRCSDMLAPPLASTVSAVMALGFTARETIPIVFFGFAICSVVITLTGKMGATYALPFPVLMRSVFGMYGSFPAICIRAFVALMWTAILTVQAGNFLQRCIEAIWPSFINFPNHLSPGAGIDCTSRMSSKLLGSR